MKKFLLLMILLPAFLPAGAQDYVINLQHWNVSDGLSHRQVSCVRQDRNGYLWIGTPAGLDRFDGTRFIHYDMDNAGLAFNDIRSIVSDDAGLLWLTGPEGTGGLCVFDPTAGRAVSLSLPPGMPVDFIRQTQDGAVLIGLRNPDQLFRWKNNRVRAIPVPDSTRFLTASDRGIWLLADHHLLEMHPDSGIVRRWPFPVKNMRMFTQYTAGAGLIALSEGWSGVYSVSPEGRAHDITRFTPPRDSGVNDYVFPIGVDGIVWRQGQLCHPTEGILRNFPAVGWDDLGAWISGVLVPRPGEIWIGGAFGLYRVTVQRSRFRRYLTDEQNLQDHHNSFRGIVADRNGLLAASQERGVLRCDLQTRNVRSVFSGPEHRQTRFNALVRRKDGSFLFSFHSWLYTADRAAEKATVFAPLNGRECWSIFEWSADTLLLGMQDGLAWVTASGRTLIPFTGYNSYRVLSTSTVHHLSAAPDGTILLATSTGLYTMDRAGRITGRFSAGDTGAHYLPATLFYHFTHDPDGSSWLATNKGLIHWNPQKGSYRAYTTREGLSNNILYGVYADDYGRLWMPSDYGLMSLERKTGTVRIYLTDDGITSNEFNRISHYRDSAGNLYFGTINGITAFHPRDLVSGRPVPHHPGQLAINAVQQFNSRADRLEDRTAEVLQTKTITLAAGDPFFTIELALLNFAERGRNHYYWRMEGPGNAWNMQQNETIRFAGLPYGQYRLHLAAIGPDGQRSRNEWIIAVTVLRPFYLQAPFIIAAVLLLGAVIGGIYYARTRRLYRDKRRLESTVQARTAALRSSLHQKDVLMKEIHHRVKNNLQVISALQQLQSTRSTDPQVKAALDESQNRVLSIAFIHHNLYMQDDLKGVEISSFVRELTAHISAVFGQPQQDITVTQEIPDMSLDIDTAVPLGLIINELLTNSYKYAFKGRDRGHIRLRIKAEGRGAYMLQYSDDGPGLPDDIDPDSVKTLGLMLVGQLSEQLCGESSYERPEGPGFRFSLLFYDFEARSQL